MCRDTERSHSHKTENKNKEKHCNLFDPGDPVEIWVYDIVTLPKFITRIQSHLDESSSGNSTKMIRMQWSCGL